MNRPHKRMMTADADEAPAKATKMNAVLSPLSIRTTNAKPLRDEFSTPPRDSAVGPIGENSSTDATSWISHQSSSCDSRSRATIANSRREDFSTPPPQPANSDPRAVRSCPGISTGMLSNFKLEGLIADGAFGTVWRATDKSSGLTVAIKRISNEKCTEATFSSEVEAMEEMACTGVVRKLDHFRSPDRDGEGCIVMEMAKGGDVFDHVQQCRSLSDWEAKVLFRQIMAAVANIHARDWVHGDLKLENVFMTEVEIKLGDLGFSHRQCAGGKSHGMRGTAHYTAPEVLLQATTAGYCGKAADLYACGVMLYIMLCGRYPFPNRPSSGISPLSKETADIFRTQSGLERVMFPPGIAAPAVALIRRLIEPSSATRAGVDEVLRSSWLAGSDNWVFMPDRQARPTTNSVGPPATPVTPADDDLMMSDAPVSRSAIKAAMLPPPARSPPNRHPNLLQARCGRGPLKQLIMHNAATC